MYTPTKLLNRYFVFAWFMSLMLIIGQCVFNSTITIFANQHGYSNTYAGSLSIGFLIGALFGRAVGGYCTDHRTRREGMIIGTAAFLAATVVFCFPIAGNGIIMMMLRFGQGFGYSCATTAYYVAAVDVAPQEKKPVALGINFTGQGMAYIVVTVLMSVCVTGTSYTMLYIVSAVIMAMAVVFSAANNYEKGKHRENGEKKKKARLLEIEPAAFPYALLIIIYDGAITLPFFYMIPLAAAKGLITGGNNIFVFIGLGMITGYLVLPKIAERFGTFSGMIPAYLSGFLSHIILIYTRKDLMFSFAGFFNGLVIATLPLMQNATVNRLPDHKKGAGTATLNGALDLTMGLMPVLWGALIDRVGFTVPFLAGAFMYAVALIVHIFVAKREKPIPDYSKNS